jgi:hypothetical protein
MNMITTVELSMPDLELCSVLNTIEAMTNSKVIRRPLFDVFLSRSQLMGMGTLGNSI